MLNKIKTLIMALALVAIPVAPLARSGVASADIIQGGLCSGANTLKLDSTNASQNCEVGNSTAGSLDQTVSDVINLLSVVVGLVAVIMIIVAGFRYVTSGGNDSSVAGAKKTLLYAIIGLIIVALAQLIVRFVLSKATANT